MRTAHLTRGPGSHFNWRTAWSGPPSCCLFVVDEFQHVWTQDRYSPEAVTPYPLHRRNSASSVLEAGRLSSADGQIARAAILKFQRLFRSYGIRTGEM